MTPHMNWPASDELTGRFFMKTTMLTEGWTRSTRRKVHRHDGS